MISRNPEQREKFVKTALRSCIRDHIDDPAIKDIAKEAATIGNDYVHFEQYTNREVKELRTLITLVWRWIDLREEIQSAQIRIAKAAESDDAPLGF